MKVNDIFYLDENYGNVAEFCNDNNLIIVEIEPDEKGRRFQILDKFPRSNQEIIEDKIEGLKNYLDTTWRWQWERYNAEKIEIEMGIREQYTISQYDLVMDRKNKVDEINKLEEELKELEQ